MSPHEIFTRSVEEHQKLKAIVAHMNQVMSQPTGTSWQAAWAESFEHLRAHVIKIFALEESDGYMRAVSAARPDKAGEVARLHEEHARLTSEMTVIMSALLPPVAESPESAPKIASKITALLNTIQQHGKREASLVQLAFNQDVSVSD